MTDVPGLLSVLVMGDGAERSRVLHDAIALRHADGSVCAGRAQVLASFDQATPGASYRILEVTGPRSLSVALEVAGISGHLVFSLHGEAIDDRLILVHVEVE